MVPITAFIHARSYKMDANNGTGTFYPSDFNHGLSVKFLKHAIIFKRNSEVNCQHNNEDILQKNKQPSKSTILNELLICRPKS